MINHRFVFALSWLGKKEQQKLSEGWKTLVQSKQTEQKHRLTVLTVKPLKTALRAQNLAGFRMTWNAAVTLILQLLLHEDNTQTLKMEPELHNTCTTLTVILNGRSWSSDRSFKQTQQQALPSSNHTQNVTPTVWNRRFYCCFLWFHCTSQ